jgi:hypothetical protein
VRGCDEFLHLSLSDVRGGVGGITPLNDTVDAIGAGSVCKGLELVERPLGFVRVASSRRGTDEDRALPLPIRLEIGVASQATILLNRSTPSSSFESASVSEKRTKPSPEGPYPLPGATTMSASSSR